MKKITLAILSALCLYLPSQAQQFDAGKGYIYDAGFVTSISNTKASELTGITYVDADFLMQFQRQGKDGANLPAGVRKTDDALIFQVQGQPELKLTDYQSRNDDDPKDSQQFSYLKSLSQFHVVAVTFRFNRPGFMLINKETLKTYFIDYRL
mgnify:CR=1 FL=1